MRHAALLLAMIAGVAAAQFTSRLTPFGDNSVRIQVAAPGNAFTDPPIQALLDVPPALRTPSTPSGDGIANLVNGNLAVAIDAATGFITATRVSDGVLLLQQTALNFAAPNVLGTRPGSVSAGVVFAGTPGEKVYGLGEHRTGSVQQLPYHKRFADSQDYSLSRGGDVSIPWYASSKGYGFVWNSPAAGYVTITTSSISWFANATMGVDVWVTTTPAGFNASSGVSPYAPLLHQYVDAVGHASRIPFFATGFIQCKDRYRNQTQLMGVAREYFKRQLPISVIVVDWRHWVEMGDWTFNPRCWPDPQGMFDELRTMSIDLMVTFWPFQTTKSARWSQFAGAGWLVNMTNGSEVAYDGNQFLVDQTLPAARSAVFDAVRGMPANRGSLVHVQSCVWNPI